MPEGRLGLVAEACEVSDRHHHSLRPERHYPPPVFSIAELVPADSVAFGDCIPAGDPPHGCYNDGYGPIRVN